MGLKSKLSKMKSFLFDEEDEEKEIKRTPKRSLKNEKKEQIVKEEEKFSETQEIEELYFEDVSETKGLEKTAEIKSRSLKNESEFKFPEFDDDDFAVPKVRQEIVVKPVKEEPKPLLYQGSKRKEETKKFKPSPIISPIYGLLDKEGNTVQNDAKKNEKLKYDEEVSLDVVRKKAYGILDEELENTMKRLSKKTIEEAEKDMEDEEKELSREKQKAKIVKEEKTVIVSSDDGDEDDDMILPNVNFKEIDVDQERTRNLKKDLDEKEETKVIEDEDDDDTKEQDLFNLIDSMYQKEGQDE